MKLLKLDGSCVLAVKRFLGRRTVLAYSAMKLASLTPRLPRTGGETLRRLWFLRLSGETDADAKCSTRFLRVSSETLIQSKCRFSRT